MISKAVRSYLAGIGRRGGAAGRGKAKVRGDREYYRRISRLGLKKRRSKRNKD